MMENALATPNMVMETKIRMLIWSLNFNSYLLTVLVLMKISTPPIALTKYEPISIFFNPYRLQAYCAKIIAAISEID